MYNFRYYSIDHTAVIPTNSASLSLLGAWHYLSVFILLLHYSQAFFPSDWREDVVGRHGISHESQTRAAFKKTATEFFGITELSTSMEFALKTIAIYNQLVDKRQFLSKEHFDGESFPEGQARLLQMKKDIANHLAVYDAFEARISCGEALHTLQDFYAHSNWIEGQAAGAVNLYPGLGEDIGVIGGPTILDDRETKDTCQDCIPQNDLVLSCDDCTFNAFTAVLTSGYYKGEDRQPPNGTRKCHHGGPKDIIRKDGINKDSLSCYWSPISGRMLKPPRHPNLFLITDAAAKDSELASTVVQEALKKQTKIHCLVFYSICSGDNTYFDIAAATGGQYFPLPRADAGTIITLADKFARAHVTPIWEIISVNIDDNTFHMKNRRQTSQEYDVPVDAKMSDLTMVYNGTGTITVTRPDGSPVSATDPDVSQVNFDGGVILNVATPAPGVYKVVVPNATNFSLSVFGESTLHFSDLSLVESSGRDGHDGYFPLGTLPDRGSTVFSTALINGEFSSSTFGLRELDGTFVQALDLTPGTGEDGLPPTNYFFGQIPIGTKPAESLC